MAKAKKPARSGMSYVYGMLRSRPIGATFATKSLRKALPKLTPSTLGNALYRIRKAKLIESVPDKPGTWRIIGDIRAWGEGQSFAKQVNSTKGSRPRSRPPARNRHPELGQQPLALDTEYTEPPVKRSEPLSDDTPTRGIIDELIDVLARAESELRRLQALDHAVNRLSGRYRVRETE